MDGKEAIINGITEKAEREAAALVASAQAERDELLAQVKAEEERKRESALESARASAQSVLSRRETICNLESRKSALAAKQQVIDAAFGESVKKILNMTDHIYREFIGGLIEKYAEDGDRVIVAERDAKRLHAEWLQETAGKCKKHITLAEEHHDGKGGIILCGKECDKNLTLETMLKSLRESSLSAVAKRLFGAENG